VGQKVNPIGFRIPITRAWQSRWFARKPEFGSLLHEDLKVREYVKERLAQAAVSKVTIERFANRVRVTVHSGRPGLVIGRKGAEIDLLKADVAKLTGGKEVYLDIKEVSQPETDAQLVAENISQQLVRRIGFKRAMKRAISTALDMGALGAKIRCSGRLGGAELARTEEFHEGKVPLHTLKANVDYGFAEARTVAGAIGVKVWICKPEASEDDTNGHDAKARKAQKGPKGRPRGKRNPKQQA